MAISVQQFIKLANLYNQTAMLMSAICVQKGGIAMENDITLIEWPEIALDVLPTDTVHVYITEYNGGRKLVLK